MNIDVGFRPHANPGYWVKTLGYHWETDEHSRWPRSPWIVGTDHFLTFLSAQCCEMKDERMQREARAMTWRTGSYPEAKALGKESMDAKNSCRSTHTISLPIIRLVSQRAKAWKSLVCRLQACIAEALVGERRLTQTCDTTRDAPNTRHVEPPAEPPPRNAKSTPLRLESLADLRKGRPLFAVLCDAERLWRFALHSCDTRCPRHWRLQSSMHT